MRCLSIHHVFLLVGVIALAGCETGQQPASKSQAGKTATLPRQILKDPEAIRMHNQAVGLMGQYEYAQAEKVLRQLVEEFPTISS